MNNAPETAYRRLLAVIEKYKKAAVAFSGGVDSTLLARAVSDALGDDGIAITVNSKAYPPDAAGTSRRLARLIGIPLIELDADVIAIDGFARNEPDRCYHCKKALFTMMLDRVRKEGFDILFDGSNVDDDDDFRPGKRALRELGVFSPLKEAGLTKDDIRAISRELDLPTWNMPSFACLASRVPYGTAITGDMLERTWRAEEVLRDLGMSQYRVRMHGDVARIEIPSADFSRLLDDTVRKKVVDSLRTLGYSYVTLDLAGYRTGSMNETLGDDV